MISNFLNHKTKSITSAAVILIITTFLAKIISLLRDRILASFFGAGRDLDIYYAAFRIPDFLFNILIIGALSSALIPVFAEHWEKVSQKKAWLLFNNVLCVFIFLILILSFLLFIFTPQLMKVVAPGFQGEDMALVVLLTRIMFLSPLLLTISNILGALLQYFSKFLIYSFAPILYNIGIIIGALFFVPRIGLLGLAFGVILGSFLHLLIQVPTALLSGFKFAPVFNFKDKGMRKIFKLMIPRTVGVAATQINLVVITAIASLLSVGSIAVFNLSNNLQYAPISLFGISFTIAAFPSLSKSFSLGDKKKFIKKFTSTFSQIIFFIIPFSFFIFILRAQIVRIILGAGNFSWSDTRLTAACLGVFAFSLFAQGLIPLLSQAFYATQDTKTPVKINIFSIVFNIVFSLFFVWALINFSGFQSFLGNFLKIGDIKNISVVGLPLAFSLTTILNIFWLLAAFKKRMKKDWDIKLRNSFLRIFLLSLYCAVLCYILLYIFAPIFGLKTFWGVFFQAFFAGGLSIVLYIYLARKFNFPEYHLITGSLLGRVSRHVVEVEAEL